MITVTYISKDRPNHLKRSVGSILHQTVLPDHIVITDCSDNREPIELVVQELKKESNIPITFIWKNKAELSRSQGRNLGRQLANTPLVVSTESDILTPVNLIEGCLKEFGNPIKKKYIQTYISLENENGTEAKFDHCGAGKQCNCGFFQVYRAEDFDNIGGYNPFFTGWGVEDKDFSQRIIEYGCEHVILPLYVTHMWHKPVLKNEIRQDENTDLSRKSYWNNQEKRWILNGRPIINKKRNAWASCNR